MPGIVKLLDFGKNAAAKVAGGGRVKNYIGTNTAWGQAAFKRQRARSAMERLERNPSERTYRRAENAVGNTAGARRQIVHDSTLGQLDRFMSKNGGHHKADYNGAMRDNVVQAVMNTADGNYGAALKHAGLSAWDAAKETGRWAWSGSAVDKTIKIGAPVAAYGALNYGGRLLTGGGATYNSDGERDIMGVPFF